jgi:hypothetical protein
MAGGILNENIYPFPCLPRVFVNINPNDDWWRQVILDG